MPTRIVANETDHSRKFGSFRLANNRNHLSLSATSVGSAISSGNGTNDCSITQRSLDSPLAKRKSSRKVVHLRSSIIRNKKGNQHLRALSSKDIRASPRLLGYCFQLLASIVMLISVSTFFYGEEKETSDEIGIIFNATDGVDSQKLYYSNESRAVFAWKLYGCFVVSGLGTIMSLVIILVHFDTIFFPTLWLHTFRDGSKREQVLLIALTIFWAVGLHFNTSSLSVGESQANVYFTTWISFFSAVLNYGIWRVSAGRTSIADLVNEHHRETTYNWLWVLFCSLIFAFSICDTYINREYIKLYFEGQDLHIEKKGWLYALILPWGAVFVSIISIALNHFLLKSCELRVFGGRFVLLGWRQAEGLVAFSLTGALFWIVFKYTGGNGIFNGLNNVYFGVWGAFINSGTLLATWLRENKNIEAIEDEERNRE